MGFLPLRFGIVRSKNYSLDVIVLGVKPLFYAERNGGLIFGSELKAILAHPDVKAEISYEGLAEVFGVGPSRKPGSGVFHHIHELRPAHALTLTAIGLRIWRYWNVKSEEHTDSLAETAEKVRFLSRRCRYTPARI